MRLSFPPLLRRVLLVDAITCAVAGLLLTIDAPLLAGWFNLSSALLRPIGIALLPYSAFLAYIATRQALPRTAVWAVITINILWILDSIVLLLGTWATPNALGICFIIVQAVAVAGLALLEYKGLQPVKAVAR